MEGRAGLDPPQEEPDSVTAGSDRSTGMNVARRNANPNRDMARDEASIVPAFGVRPVARTGIVDQKVKGVSWHGKKSYQPPMNADERRFLRYYVAAATASNSQRLPPEAI
jgi:hypothetical protein